MMVLKAFEELCESIFKDKSNLSDKWFNDYLGKLKTKEGVVQYYNNIRYLLDLGNIDLNGKTVCDIGSGFGIISLLFGLMGAKKVVAIEHNEEMVNRFNYILKNQYKGNNIEAIDADVLNLSKLNLTYDFIFCQETLSHFVYPEKVMEELKNLIVKGGTFLISDGNNGHNFLVEYETRKKWKKMEGDKNNLYYDNYETYYKIRNDILKENFPDLSENERGLIAENTFKKTKDEIIEIGKKYIQTKEMPSFKFEKNKAPLHPNRNHLSENLIYAEDVKKVFEDGKGGSFDVKIYGHFFGGTRRDFPYLLNRFLQSFPKSYYFSKAVVILVKKK